LRVLPRTISKYIFLALAYIVYLFDSKHNKIAMSNLDLAFGDSLDLKRKNEIIKNSYKNLFFDIFEFVQNQYLDKDRLLEKVKTQNEEVLIEALKQNRRVILITAHYGNWELISPYVGIKYDKTVVQVGKKLSNKLLDKDMLKIRNKNNCEMLYKKESAKGLIKALKNEKILGLAIDQNISQKAGLEVKFFDHRATQADSPARLAKKFDAIIIPVFSVLNDFCDYTIKFYEPIDINGSNLSIEEATQIQADVIEKQIREYPDIWFWQHKRWKEFYKEIYN
jgi:KDO2-lipid IV(A) lauroyltransferase